LLKKIFLYNGIKKNYLNLKKIKNYLEEKTGFKIEIRDEFINYCISKISVEEEKIKLIDKLSDDIARIRIINPNKKEIERIPHPIEINLEKKYILKWAEKPIGNFYNGFELILIFSNLIPKEETNLKYCHIVFTNQLFGTWDEKNFRYHARVVVFGFPTIISTTGLVEGPAKPREFYLKKQMGIDPLILKEEFKGRFIDYEDPRITEIMKGYVMQAIFFHLFGNPFCSDKNCRLYNAHWQEEVINAQLKGDYEFCGEHEGILKKIKA
jgi:hypothetical protein